MKLHHCLPPLARPAATRRIGQPRFDGLRFDPAGGRSVARAGRSDLEQSIRSGPPSFVQANPPRQQAAAISAFL